MIKTTNLRDSHKFYLENTSNPNPVKAKIYLRIVAGYIKYIIRKVFEGHDVQLSGGRSLGSIGIRGTKVIPKLNEQGEIRGLAPDWGSTRKLWESNPEAKEKRTIVYHTNDHTNGVRYKLVWWREGMNIGNKRIYSLVFCKANKRMVKPMILSGKEYLVNS